MGRIQYKVLCLPTSLTIVDVKVGVTLQLQELSYQSVAFLETETFLIDTTNNMENMLEQEYMIESYVCRSAFLGK